ncbi:MAG: SRPBCC domain-containing protein [bacterium]|nr:SRPBCC domain-containing protein [bacterium]
MDEEKVFKALADENRRKMLDLLFERDGQTLSELEAHFPMTRFGVMKHLQQLEDAGLLTTKKVGREKFHYLNTVPIQLAYDRWVSKYAQPWAQSLTGLKTLLEEPSMEQKPAATHIFHIFIRTTPEKLWQALTDGTFTQQYYFGTKVSSSWEKGAPYTYAYPNGETMIEGEVLESDPPRRLVTTFMPRWGADTSAHPSKVVFEIEPRGEACKLTLTHEPVNGHSLGSGIVEGWSEILSGLKSLLETGEPLVVGASSVGASNTDDRE